MTDKVRDVMTNKIRGVTTNKGGITTDKVRVKRQG
jgi:hypothetical protein